MNSDFPPELFPIEPPSLIQLLRVWFSIGISSFGGGSSTFALIQRAVVEQEHWATNEELLRDNALCQLAPGINLFALTILIGRRLRGWPGIAVSLLGLILPSVTITAFMTAFYSQIRHMEAVRDALNGLIPATIGLGLLSAGRISFDLLRTSRSEGNASLSMSLLLLLGSGFTILLFKFPVLFILWGAGTAGAAFRWIQSGRRGKGER